MPMATVKIVRAMCKASIFTLIMLMANESLRMSIIYSFTGAFIAAMIIEYYHIK